jgi:hypothetical protein
MQGVILLKQIIEYLNKTYSYFYLNKGIIIGKDKITGKYFNLNLNSNRLFIIINQGARIRDFILDVIEKTSLYYKSIYIEWHDELIKEKNGKSFINKNLKYLGKFFSYFDSIYDFITYFTELLIEYYNLSRDEATLLRRILIDRLYPQNKEIITFKDIFNIIKESYFKSQYENEIKYNLNKKLEELISNKILEEIIIENKKEKTEIKNFWISLGILNNFRLKLILLNLIFNTLFKIKNYSISIIFFNIPTSLISYIYKSPNLQLWDLFYQIVKSNQNIFLILDKIEDLPKEIIDLTDLIAIEKDFMNQRIEELLELKRQNLNTSNKAGEILILDKDGEVFNLERISEQEQEMIIFDNDDHSDLEIIE